MKSILSSLLIVLISVTLNAATFVVTSTANGGSGSLRTAINNANNTVGKDTITFNFGNSVSARTISITSALPAVTEALVIDGSTLPNSSFGNSDAKVLIRTSTSGVQGLRLYADSCEIYGLYLKGFSNGLSFNVSSLNIGSIVGAPGKGNVISGNTNGGISAFNMIGTIIQSNFIGLDTTGVSAENNIGFGISASSYVNKGVIEGNVISNNNLGGIYLAGGDSLFIRNNKIGVTYQGDSPAGNGGIGVYVGYVGENEDYLIENNIISSNLEGGMRVSSNNVIIRNNFIGTDVTGSLNLGNLGAYGLSIDGKNVEINNNVISGNSGKGIIINLFARNILVTSNKIGSDITGLNDIGNGSYGIEINGDSCTIGGLETLHKNIIAGNLSGIYLSADDINIYNNNIGIGNDGSTPIGNDAFGILISNALNFKIGNGIIGGNLISKNFSKGIQFNSGDGLISGNIIGVSADSIPFSVGQYRGIELWNSASGKIENNLIEGHTADGIYLQSASNVEIVGNTIQGNIEQGIELTGSCQNITIGFDSLPNFIQSNGLEGIRLSATCNEVSMFANRLFCNAQSDASEGIFGDAGFNSGILPGSGVLSNGTLTGTAIPGARIDLFSGTENCTACEGTNLLQTIFTDDLGNWQATISAPTPRLMFMATEISSNSSSEFSTCIQNTVSLTQIKSSPELFPNPFNEGFMLNSQAKNFRLIDLHGRVILQGEIISPEQWINTELISSGIYFLELDQQEIQRKRLIKIN